MAFPFGSGFPIGARVPCWQWFPKAAELPWQEASNGGQRPPWREESNEMRRCCGKDNSYGHPTEEVLSRLRDAEVTTFRTDMQGDISCVSDGKTVEFTVSRNKDADVFASVGTNSTQKAGENNATEPAAKSEPVGQTYVLNTNTKKFHNPTCRSVKQMKDKNKKDFCGSREEVIAKGYSLCKNCNP